MPSKNKVPIPQPMSQKQKLQLSKKLIPPQEMSRTLFQTLRSSIFQVSDPQPTYGSLSAQQRQHLLSAYLDHQDDFSQDHFFSALQLSAADAITNSTAVASTPVNAAALNPVPSTNVADGDLVQNAMPMPSTGSADNVAVARSAMASTPVNGAALIPVPVTNVADGDLVQNAMPMPSTGSADNVAVARSAMASTSVNAAALIHVPVTNVADGEQELNAMPVSSTGSDGSGELHNVANSAENATASLSTAMAQMQTAAVAANAGDLDVDHHANIASSLVRPDAVPATSTQPLVKKRPARKNSDYSKSGRKRPKLSPQVYVVINTGGARNGLQINFGMGEPNKIFDQVRHCCLNP